MYMLKTKLKVMKVVLLLALACVVRSWTLNQRNDESRKNLEDREKIWERDMILTKEQAEELYGKNPEISERDQNDISEQYYPSDLFEDGFQIREGDMRLSDDQIEALYGQAHGSSGYSEGRTLWPDGIVPYIIDPSAYMHEKKILEAIRKWEDVTCIKFMQRRTDYPGKHVVFWTNHTYPKDCSSQVGMSGNNWQSLHLGKNCNDVGTVIHEIGHAVGFFHEQSRMDRDSYVRILKENIDETKFIDNFKKETSLHKYFTIPYDYGSLMHFGLADFTINGKNTIIPYNPKHTLEIGQRDNLSFSDIKLANIMYNCSAKCSKELLCKNGGFLDKNCKCQCPNDYGGPNCEKIIPPPVPACGGTDNESGVVIQTPNYPSNPPTATKCIWEFKAPAGKNVQVLFESFQLSGREQELKTCNGEQVHIRGGGYNGEHTYCGDELDGKTLSIGPHENGTFILYKADDFDDKHIKSGFKAYVEFL